LYSALQAGCIGVEADVWLVEDELYVGHSKSSLAPNRTLKNLYINPLLDVLAKQNPTTKFHPKPDSPPNGVFDTDHAQTLVLLVDFKTDGPSLWPHVHAQLDPLRQKGLLTHFDGTSVKEGPVTVVATGDAPFDLLTSNSTFRDIFFDAPLDRIAPDATPSNQNVGQDTSGNAPTTASAYNTTNSYYASTSFGAAIGTLWSNPSTTQLERIRAQIKGAHQQGLKARYWETPSWPRGLRDHIWNVLLEEGADFLNVDDLKAATQGTWGKWS
jgi:rRNA biogenesis protein RRP5